MLGNNFLLWENHYFILKTPFNPHIPYSEGFHIVINSKSEIETAWQDPELSAAGFRLAANACKLLDEIGFAPWFNIQVNGNFGLLPGVTKYFHIHLYGRNKTDRFGKPIILPEAPKTYNNDPMPEADRQKLIKLFKEYLS